MQAGWTLLQLMFVIVFDWSIRILKWSTIRTWYRIAIMNVNNQKTNVGEYVDGYKNTGQYLENAKRWGTVLLSLLLLFLRFGDFWWAFFAFFAPFCACWTAFSLWKTLKVIIGCSTSITNNLIYFLFYFLCRITIAVYRRGRMKKGFVLAEARWFLSVTCRTFFP